MLLFNGSHTNDLRDFLPPTSTAASIGSFGSATQTNCYAADGPLQARAQAKPGNPLARKLSNLVELDGEDCEALKWISRNARRLRAGHILIHEGSRPTHLCLILSGTAVRYKMLPSGKRQILGYLLPGDLCDVHFLLNNRPDHSLALLTSGEVAEIPLRCLSDLIHAYPRIERALMLTAMMDRATLREWLINVGQRDAFQRISHFFCEMHWRSNLVGLVAPDGSFDFPINQYALADTLGLTSVHVNRTLQRLRAQQQILLYRRRLTILDHDSVSEQAGFDEHYLRAHQPAVGWSSAGAATPRYVSRKKELLVFDET